MCATIFQMISLKYPYIDWYFELSSVYFKIYIDTSSGVERAIILFWDKLFVIWFPQVKLLMQHFFIFFFLREAWSCWWPVRQIREEPAQEQSYSEEAQFRGRSQTLSFEPLDPARPEALGFSVMWANTHPFCSGCCVLPWVTHIWKTCDL